MKRLVSVVAGSALVVVAGLVAVGQSDLIAGLTGPVIINLQQSVPITVDLALPQADGSVITATAPLTVGIGLQITIDGQHIASVAIAEPAAPVVAVAAPTPTPAAATSFAELAIVSGGMTEPIEIGGFQLQVSEVAVYDFAQLAAFDTEHNYYYADDAFTDASLLITMRTTVTNTSEQDLEATTHRAIAVIGQEQVYLGDFSRVSDDVLTTVILPEVVRDGTVAFSVISTTAADIANGTELRLKFPGPYARDGFPLNSDAAFEVTIPLNP